MSDLLAAAGRGAGLIAGIEAVWDVIVVQRGHARVEIPDFVLADWYQRML